jgi:hypothetical protein
MDGSTFWRAAVVQTVLVGVLAVVLAIALPRSFFEDWGWLAGPAAWAGCAAITGRLLALPVVNVLVGAALAGIPALLAVVAGVHWLGTALAVALFAMWCARLSRDPDLPAEMV